MTNYAVRICSALLAIAAAAFMGTGAGCGSDSGSGGSASTSGSGGGGGSGPNCDDYCASVMANCTGDHAVYVSADVCKAVCADFPVGKDSDTTGNTLGCRSYHAGSPAKMDPAFHCPHAGPGGDAYCGSNCEGFCAIALAACPSDYKDEADCMSACKKFPTLEPMEPFTINDTTGNTIECRLYHASVATTDPATHCPHITPKSTPDTCQDPQTP